MGSEYGANAIITGSLEVDGDIDLGSGDDDVDLDSGTLYVDGANNRVGISTSSPLATLHIKSSGDTTVAIEGTQDVTLGIIVSPNKKRSAPFVITDYLNSVDDIAAYLNAAIETGGKIAIGDAVQAADARLHIKEAAGDIFKMENTTAYGVTYGQLVKENLTLTDGGSPIDTTLDLPASSMITDVLITIKTLAVGDASTITNVAIAYGDGTFDIKGSSFTGMSMIASAGLVAVGTQYVLGNTDQSFPAGRATLLLGGTADIKLAYTDTNITTEPVIDVVVFYKKFDTT